MEVLEDTYKDTKIGSIPKDWDTLKINQVADCYGGTTPSTVVEEYWNGDILWATPSDITKNKSEYLLNTSRKITEQGRASKNLRFVKKNGLLMTSRASIGFLNISNGDVVTNQGFINIECKNNFHYKFFYYWVLDNRKKLLSLSQGSTFLELYRKTFAKINIPAPPLPEQQKIAAILSTVDEQISTTDKIIEKSKELKKALMQKLFSEGIGHTEFKDTKIGRIPKDWEVNRLDNWLELITYGFTNPMPTVENGPFMVSAADVKNGKIQYDTCRKTSNEAFETKISKKSKPIIGDVLLTKDGTLGRVGLVTKENLCITQSIALLRPKNIGCIFLTYLLASPYYQNRMIRDAGGSTIKHIYITVVNKMKVAIPSIDEQQKIADILSEADAKIEKEQTQKLQLEALKKGLMQQLLTGKKRVKV
tara:strand:- start:974 stop:2233 length:1260 start_codon:yes stop_codon:yes gene_type:complete